MSTRTILRSAAGVVAAFGMATAVAMTVPGSASAASWDCPGGNICFYSGDNGSGQRCVWDTDDRDWRNGADQCSWAADKNVRSVFNNDTKPGFTGVVYYKGANYDDRAGCTKQGQKGNLAGTYKLRSHQWTTGHCGK